MTDLWTETLQNI